MLDQHFMINKEVLIRIVNIADLNKGDNVLEIGPGKGALTEYILKIVKRVYAIEKDEKFVEILQEKFGNNENITFSFANAMEMNFPACNKCVSNLPYTLCESLLWKFTRYPSYEMLVFTVPKKFALALTGEKKSRLKLLVDVFYELEIFDDIPPEAFDPQPKVVSTIIRLMPKKNGNFFLRELFKQYDKKTKNALREMLMKTGQNKREASMKVQLNLRLQLQNKAVMHLSVDDVQEVIKGFVSE